MEECDISALENISTPTDQVQEILKNFIKRNENTFSFPDLSQDQRRLRVWRALVNLLNLKNTQISIDSLACIRILSRDRTNMDTLISATWLDALLQHAGIFSKEEAIKRINEQDNNEIILEAVKCLCNIIFNSKAAQQLCAANYALEGIVNRLRTYRDHTFPDELKYFDIKLLFLMTVLNIDSRRQLKNELHGMTYLMEIMDVILKEASGDVEYLGATGGAHTPLTLSDSQVQLLCEVLKVLFNICCEDKTSLLDEESEAHSQRLVCILRDLLLASTSTPEKRAELQNHTVNMLTSVPSVCLSVLVAPLPEKEYSENVVEYQGRNLEAVSVLVEILRSKLDGQGEEKFTQTELLGPILSVLGDCARSQRILRKFLRMQILPPLRDTRNLPEVGNTLRNQLCRFLTSPNTQLKELVAELLFVLCKENVSRMTKYTGYGNAAGLLANRGLLGGRRKDDEKPPYSSESEDSDTEEYKRDRAFINPVTGRWEPPRPSPFEGMSEEQKEHEAVQLANLMAKLSNERVIQPCRIGADGRPEPVDHIMQLQQECAQQQYREGHSSDED